MKSTPIQQQQIPQGPGSDEVMFSFSYPTHKCNIVVLRGLLPTMPLITHYNYVIKKISLSLRRGTLILCSTLKLNSGQNSQTLFAIDFGISLATLLLRSCRK